MASSAPDVAADATAVALTTWTASPSRKISNEASSRNDAASAGFPYASFAAAVNASVSPATPPYAPAPVMDTHDGSAAPAATVMTCPRRTATPDVACATFTSCAPAATGTNVTTYVPSVVGSTRAPTTAAAPAGGVTVSANVSSPA